MGAKDFRNAMNKQRTANPPSGGQGRLGVVGDIAPNPLREELEQVAEKLPVQEIPINLLLDNPFQHLARPVINEEALEELASSIKENGFFGTLLARKKKNSNSFELAFGHRRRDASIRAKLETLPVKVLDLSETQMARIMASENFSREDLSPLGEANVVGFLYTSQNMTIDQVAEVIGKKRGWVQPRLQLYEAPANIKEMVAQKPESMSHVRLLSQVTDAQERAFLIQQILEEGLTFEQLRGFVDLIKQGISPSSRFFDNNFTNNSNAVVSEINNKLKEKKINFQGEDRDIGASVTALQKLDKAAARFEKLLSLKNYEITPGEKNRLADIVSRLSSFLE